MHDFMEQVQFKVPFTKNTIMMGKILQFLFRAPFDAYLGYSPFKFVTSDQFHPHALQLLHFQCMDD